jgi:CelD/BcsL family acetyltransferase involved in cellulose biosynthesis
LKVRKRWLRCYVLYLADRPTGFWIGDINQGIFGSDYLGFDPEFEKYSPGMYLILKVIEGFCEGNGEKVSGVDFAAGHTQHKEVLSSSVLTETSVYIFAESFKGLAINIVNTVALATDKALKQVLERTGFLQKVKKAFRG